MRRRRWEGGRGREAVSGGRRGGNKVEGGCEGGERIGWREKKEGNGRGQWAHEEEMREGKEDSKGRGGGHGKSQLFLKRVRKGGGARGGRM